MPLRAVLRDAPDRAVTVRKAPAAATQARGAPARKALPSHRLYTVRAGDTLAAIAVRTHVSVPKLLELNPHVQPTSLFIGQKLRLE